MSFNYVFLSNLSNCPYASRRPQRLTKLGIELRNRSIYIQISFSISYDIHMTIKTDRNINYPMNVTQSIIQSVIPLFNHPVTFSHLIIPINAEDSNKILRKLKNKLWKNSNQKTGSDCPSMKVNTISILINKDCLQSIACYTQAYSRLNFSRFYFLPSLFSFHNFLPLLFILHGFFLLGCGTNKRSIGSRTIPTINLTTQRRPTVIETTSGCLSFSPFALEMFLL